jgi:tRNA pseudouridine13 synthase
MQAIHYISKRLRKVPRQFAIAGNKDKRGITTQRVTIHRMDAEYLIRQQRCKDWDQKIKVGSFDWVFKPLQLGSLNGNRFAVALRFISPTISNAQITANVNSVIKHGFINYFGMQRFGQYSIHTHEIGRACLQQNWKEVCRMLL